MVGVAGKSGGARPNTGGARPGAGRPRKGPQPPVISDESDPLRFLLKVMQGTIEANPTQLKAAVAAVQYTHVKKGDGGKKDEKAEAAERAAAKFNTPRAPLKVVG
jgi:phage terminase small subunit